MILLSFATRIDLILLLLAMGFIYMMILKGTQGVHDNDKEKDKENDKNKENGKDKEKEKEKETKKEEKEEDKSKGKKEKAADKKEDDKSLKLDLDGLDDRVERLTLSSSFIAAMAISPDGDKLYYLASRDGSYDLWELNTREKTTKTIGNFKGGGANMVMDEKGENLYLLVGGSITQVKTADGKSKGVSYSAEMYLDQAAERYYMFEHMWRQVSKKFYVEDLHGVDWEMLKKEYAVFLPHINNNRDYAEMMSELLGELNGSHTGCRYGHSDPKGDQTAALGIIADHNHRGAGIKIAEVIDKSPLRIAEANVKAGMIIEKIDGETIAAGQNYFPMLNHKAGKTTLLTIFDPVANKRMDVAIKPISLGAESNLLYERWVINR
jgi:tricorn protease